MATGDSMTRVLIIDDDHDAADAMAELLSMEGYETQTSYSGADGLTAGPLFSPHIILLDLTMPDVDGRDVCRSIRAASWGQNVRVFALTGHSHPLTEEAGFNGQLLKPVDLNVLLRAVGENS